jgi:hypothetical protein
MNMTDEEIEKIAETIFQKMLAKQDQWDKEFITSISTPAVIGRDAVINEITELNLMKAEFVKEEKYEEAYKVMKKIKILSDQLRNNKD